MSLVSKINGIMPSAQVSTFITANPTSASKKRASTVGGFIGKFEYTGGASSEQGRCIWVDASGNIYIGNYESRAITTPNITKLNSSGVIQWSKTINKSGNGSTPYRIFGDSTYVYCYCSINNGNGVPEQFIIKINQSTGADTTSKVLTNANSVTYSQTPRAFSIRPDGSLVAFATVTESTYPQTRACVITMDSGLSTISWQRGVFRSAYQFYNAGGTTGGSANFTYQFLDISYLTPSKCIQKLQSDGTQSWLYTIDKLGTEPMDGIVDSSDNLYIASTITSSPLYGGYDIAVVKLDSNGTVTAAKAIGRSGTGEYEQAYGYGKCIAWDDTKTYFYVLGYATPSGGSSDSADWWIGKFDTSLNLQWQRFIGGGSYPNSYDLPGGLFVKGNWVYMTGYIQDSAGNNQHILCKIPTDGSGLGNSSFTFPDGNVVTYREADLSIGNQTGVVTASAGALYSNSSSAMVSMTSAGANVDAVTTGYQVTLVDL